MAIGEDRCRLPVRHVKEILRLRPFDPAVGSTAPILGPIDWAGRLLPVLDVRRIMGRPVGLGRRSCLVVVQTGGGEFASREAALLVDGVAAVARIAEPEVAPVDRPPLPRGAPVVSVTRFSGRWHYLIDVERLLEERLAQLVA